ncbi:hypothetical protein FNV43_RR09876 [Rhamnella rubrinervis]|uniref:Beta-glucosidase n=1 Tax=Rhamnella rubrinervis TaxID=2594499 RepID=A0A8K0HBK7_9ROSA|nr:hypothetical protein FNV43_RR09876 [Rhamnella rubrinervis]
MASKGRIILGLFLLLVTSSSCSDIHFDVSWLNRSSFPEGFVFGTASSAYQYEGAAREGGRGPSIWDYHTHKYPEKIKDGSNGDVAIDEYHRYKEDVGIMKEMNLDAYRFSISWPRLLPSLEPYVTLFHWDVPQTLEHQYGGFLSPRIVKHFRDYAELCFREFGDRVKHWITLNEPLTFSSGGYAAPSMAPYRCSEWQQLNCTGGDSGTEPYLVTHHQLLSHAAAVKIYRDKYQASQKGLIGITLNCNWMIPYSEAEDDKNAAVRALDFMFGWYMDPLTNGDYPYSMRSLVGERLPEFSKEDSKLVKGSFDFWELITTLLVTAMHLIIITMMIKEEVTPLTLAFIKHAASDWLYVYPRGIRDLLLYTKTKYHNPLIYVTENGIDEVNDPNLSLEQALVDNHRIDYYHSHLYYLQKAIKDGVNVKGYFAWSLLDNYEWSSGYTVRFGINYVDYKNGLKRHPKLSAHWFKAFLERS